MPRIAGRPALRALERAAARDAHRALVPIPPNDNVVSFVPLRRLNYTAMAHRETLLPPDLSLAWQLQRLHPRKGARTAAACVLRDPVLRVEAELVRRCMRLHRCDRQGELKRIGEQMRDVCALSSRDRVFQLSHDSWHVIPQSWYIWDARGAVQCECLLAREPIRKAAGILRSSTDLRHDLLRHGHLWMQPSAAFHVLMLERPLVEQVERQLADAPFGTCYRPQPRPPAPNNASCW